MTASNSICILKESNFIKMPWKNGRGVTKEIFRLDVDGFMAFRVSSAEVTTSGPFSYFAGYDRTLVNLGPASMYLTIGDAKEEELRVHQLIHFDGESATSCKVDAPSTDLNVFCARNIYFASTVVRALTKPEFFPLTPESGVLIYTIRGSLVVRTKTDREYLINEREAILRVESNVGEADRWMLASASDQPCVYAVIVFRKKLPDSSYLE